MVSHITVRLAWHDNNWNGQVCRNPEQNSYCVGSHSLLSGRIAKKRKLELEQKNPCADCEKLGGYIPPCYWSINAFGKKKQNFLHEHAFEGVKVNPIKEVLNPYSVFSWPFKLSFVHDEENKKKFGNYPPDLNRRIERFGSKFQVNESIVLLYCNYDNPVSADDMRYLLVGCAFLKEKGEPTFFEDINGDIEKRRKMNHAMKNFPTINWALEYSYDFENNGVLLPYKEYLEYTEANPEDEEKLNDLKVEIEEDSLISGFKYVAMDIDDDKYIYLLYKLKKANSNH